MGDKLKGSKAATGAGLYVAPGIGGGIVKKYQEKQETKEKNKERDEAEARAAENAENARLSALERDRKKRMSMFQTAGGTGGEEVMNVGMRGSIFAN